MIDIEACEKAYGKLIKEDERFCYFEGKSNFGVCIPKDTYFNLQPSIPNLNKCHTHT